jgi:hypothetical protein
LRIGVRIWINFTHHPTVIRGGRIYDTV